MRVTAILLAAAIFAAPAFADKKEKKGPVFEPNTYRFGGTYSVMSSRSASQCSATCGRDARCLSWSFVDLPGASGQNACELKSNIGRSETNPTATSGISPRLESKYQPSPYRDASTLLGAHTTAPKVTSRRITRSAVRKPAAAPAPRTVTPSKSAAIQSRTTRTQTVVPKTTATTSKRVIRKAPPAPAVITQTPAKPKAPAPVPVAAPKPQAAPPIKVTTAPANPSVKPAPQVQFQPLKRSVDGTYKPTAVKPAGTAQPKTSRVVLTGPTGEDVAKSVNGRVVLTGDMAGATSGGVGETPAAPIPRNAPVNAQGERVPYKDLSSREYPDYSVTRAAEDGGIESISGEAGS